MADSSLLTTLTAYWALDEASGNSRADSLSTNALTDSGAVGHREGVIGTAADLTTGSEFLYHADSATFSPGNTDFTFAGWVCLDSKATGQAILGQWRITTNSAYLLLYSAGADRFAFRVTSDGAATGQTQVDADTFGAVSTGTWYFVAAWHDATNDEIGISVNGGAADTAAHSTGVYDSTTAFRLGVYYDDLGQVAPLDGGLNQWGYWGRILTSAERTALYNGGDGLTYPFNESWTKYASNPVITPGAYSWDATGVHSPHITEYDADTWVMLFAAHDGTNWTGIGYATAPKSDPHNWTRNSSLIITSGTSGAWDDNIHSVTGFYDSGAGEWQLLYGANDGGIGLATGSTLATLGKYESNPVLTGQGTGWEEFVRHPALIKVGSTYHLIYDGRQGTPTSGDGAIGHATSSDLITWSRDGGNPILDVTTHAWELTDLGSPDIELIEGTYYLFYTGYDGTGSPYPHAIGYYTSSDLSTWTVNASNPVVGPDFTTDTGWDGIAATAPGVMYENGNLHLYYTGGDSTPGDTKIGYTSQDVTPGLAAPSDLTTTVTTPTQIDLAWTDNASGEVGYKIDRSLNGTDWTQIDTAAANATSYSDTTVTAGLTYYYRVRAYDLNGNSAFSNSDYVAGGTPRHPMVMFGVGVTIA